MSCPVATSERLFIFNCAPSQTRGKRRYRGQPGERLTRGEAMNHQARSKRRKLEDHNLNASLGKAAQVARGGHHLATSAVWRRQ
jgi:hypothetical protein